MSILAKGAYVVLEPIKEKNMAGQLETVTELDDSNRYIKGKVLSAGEATGLEGGETIFYDKQNTFGIRDNGNLYQVVLAHNVIGIHEED